MKNFEFIFFAFLCAFAQNICYSQHIPLGITRSEIPKYIQKLGGGIIKYPPPGVHEYKPEYTDSTVMGADSVKMFGYKGHLGFSVSESGKIYTIDLSVKSVLKADYEKISKSFVNEFHLKLKKARKNSPTFDRFWSDIKNNPYITHASIVYYPWQNSVIINYTNRKYY